MTPRTIDNRDAIMDALYDSVDDAESALHEGYSGRGMYGDECFGIVVDDIGELCRFFAYLGADHDTDLADRLARVARTDSMGRSMIVYFPGYTLGGESEDDE